MVTKLKSFIVLLCLVNTAIAIPAPNSPIVCQPPPAPPLPCCISSEWWTGGWIYLVFVGISVLLLSLALVYMVSQIIGKHEWVVWIKDEFYQTMISVIIVVMLIIVLSAVCDLFKNISGTGQDPFAIAHTFLDDLVWDKTINLATRAFQDSLICQLVSGYKTQMGPPSLGISYQQSMGLRTIATDFDFLYTLFAGLSASLMVQDIGLSVIQAFAFRIMLPIGILLRVFPFIRKAGAMLIALSLGLYIVFPMCFVMDKVLLDSVMPGISSELAWNVNTISSTYMEPFVLVIVSPLLPWAIIELVYLIQQAALLVPQALFLPTLNLVITLTFVKSATRVLSENFGEG